MSAYNKNSFLQKKVAATGKLHSCTRKVLITRLRSWGAIPAYKVSRRTDFLIVGIKPGSKLIRAREFGVTIIYEQEIEYLLDPKEQHNEDEAL